MSSKRVFLHLGEECNLKCKYCYQSSLHDSRSLFKYELNEEFIRYLSDKYDGTDTTIVYFGGEPLLYLDEIIKIENILKDKNIKRSIISNGLNLTPSIVKYFNNDERLSFVLSHDGPNTDYLRGVDILKIPRLRNLIRSINNLSVSMVSCDYSNNVFDCWQYTKKLLHNKEFYYAINNYQSYSDNDYLISNYDFDTYKSSMIRYLGVSRSKLIIPKKLGLSTCSDGKIRNQTTGKVLGYYKDYDYKSDSIIRPEEYPSSCDYYKCKYYKKSCQYKPLQITDTTYCKKISACNLEIINKLESSCNEV